MFVLLLLAALPAELPAQTQGATIQGTLSRIEGTALTLTLADGSLQKVTLPPDAFILARQESSLEAIAPGDALGVAARREADGSLTATGINIFSPQLWDRVRKGQFPMPSGEVMTNALVTGYSLGDQGHLLRLKYDDLVTTISTPEDVRVTRIVTRRSADLKVGMSVTVRGQMDEEGSLAAGSLSFEIPPER